MSRCKIYGGTIDGGGQATSIFAIGENVLVDNCLVADTANSTSGAPALLLRGGAKAVNCTIAHTSRATSAYDTDSKFINCVIYNPTGSANSEWGNANGAAYVNCACTVAISGGTNNMVVADPKFVDAANGDYHLANDSPLVDAGDLSAYRESGASMLDLDRSSRTTKRTIDIGAYERFVPSGFSVHLL